MFLFGKGNKCSYVLMLFPLKSYGRGETRNANRDFQSGKLFSYTVKDFFT